MRRDRNRRLGSDDVNMIFFSRNLTFEAVVELGSSAQEQVNPSAEGGVSGQEESDKSTFFLGAHPPQQLQQPHTNTAFYSTKLFLLHMDGPAASYNL